MYNKFYLFYFCFLKCSVTSLLPLLYVKLDVYIKLFLTLLGSTAVSLRASIGRSLGILRQMILSRPIKDVTPVLRETTDTLILKTTHMVWYVRVWEGKKQEKNTLDLWHVYR